MSDQDSRILRRGPEIAGEPLLRPETGAALDRRRFVQLMAASLALGGLTACDQSGVADQAVPYVELPPGVVPGVTSEYATAVTNEGYATGVLVQHRMGRPIGLAGNSHHPASLGAVDPLTQAAILDLYDPDRSAAVLERGRIAGLSGLVAGLAEHLAALRGKGGEGLRLLSGTVTSPTLTAQLGALAASLPGMRWHRWDSGFRDNVRAGAVRAFGHPVDTVLHPDRADVILAFDSDLLDAAPGHLSYARGIGARRRDAGRDGAPMRLYAVESTPTLAGANADHRFVVSPVQVEKLARAILARLRDEHAAIGDLPAWVAPLAADLASHKGRALVHVGPEQPPGLHALAHAMNQALGAVGATITNIDPVESDPVDHLESLKALGDDMRAGRVDTLIVIGGNPVFTAPADLGFADALDHVPFSLHLGTQVNETAARTVWHLPEAHELERWGDARAFDGTVTIQQPQLRPLYGGWSPVELAALLLGDSRPDGYAILRAAWQKIAAQRNAGDFEAFWTGALRTGTVPGTQSAPVDVAPRPDPPVASAPPAPAGALLALFRPDPFLRDGRFANNGWLQELPRPLTKLTWDNAVLIAPQTAAARGLADGDLVDVKTAAGTVRAPVFGLPGQAVDVVTLPLGFGRTAVGRVGRGAGFDAFALRSAASLWQSSGVEIVKAGGRRDLASTQRHDRMAGRDLVRTDTVDAFRGRTSLPPTDERHPGTASLYPSVAYPGNAWAMAIDLSSCIGCGSCTIACQGENNIPVVGKEEVLRAREMHWIRVDRYHTGPTASPQTLFQPVPCMHCEEAPCEVVCPVEATVHDSDGLNVMVYNRCVGTRFCSNNCPYKVRRFNFFDYTDKDPRLDLAWNPDLSVRGRGVMEKCTYCIQRIRETKIVADRENRDIADGEIVTACQAACPTQAIVFGDLNDPKSAVRRRKATPLDYALLGDLNTRPRTTYQTRLLNPNPAIAPEDEG